MDDDNWAIVHGRTLNLIEFRIALALVSLSNVLDRHAYHDDLRIFAIGRMKRYRLNSEYNSRQASRL
jgi:hypothetical protein